MEEGNLPVEATETTSAKSAATATVTWLRDLFLSVLIAIVVILFLYQPVNTGLRALGWRLARHRRRIEVHLRRRLHHNYGT